MRFITQLECNHLDILGLVDRLNRHRTGRNWQDDISDHVFGVRCPPQHGGDYGVWVFKPDEAWQVIILQRNLKGQKEVK